MIQPTVFVALQQFCEADNRPRRLLQEAGFQVRENGLGRRLHREEIPEVLKDADAVVAGVEPYDAQTLKVLPRLKCISRCGAGTDAIDLEAASHRQIAVLTTPEEVVEPVAQLTLLFILALARNLPLHLRDFDAGRWRKVTGWLLSEWTVGLMGFGRIGQAVANLLRPFAPRILVSDPAPFSGSLSPGVTRCDGETLLKESDLVSLHASCPREDRFLIGEKELTLMKKGACLVNTARGHLVDERALERALRSNHLGGAALDVFEEEPYQGTLMGLPQVILTPHVASLTYASRSGMELRSVQNLIEFFQRDRRSP